jgi:hypothetical protein
MVFLSRLVEKGRGEELTRRVTTRAAGFLTEGPAET